MSEPTRAERDATPLRCVCGWRGLWAQCPINPRQGYIVCPACDRRGYDRIPYTEEQWAQKLREDATA